MNKRVLPKSKLDELIQTTIDFYNCVCLDERVYGPILKRRFQLADELGDSILNGLYLTDLLGSIYNMAQGDTYEAVYKVLEVLGWQVTDDESGEHRAVDE